MNLDDLILQEFLVYRTRFDVFKADENNELSHALAAESERILKQLFTLKYQKTPIDEPILWLNFMADLGKNS